MPSLIEGDRKTPTGRTEPPADHLSGVSPTARMSADGDREWFCKQCGSRVTRTPDRPVEFGHAGTCDHRPDDWPHTGRSCK